MTESSKGLPASGHRVVILGAGPARGVRHPVALTKVLERGTVLDWQLAAYSVLGDCQISFVGGYRVSDILSSFPGIHTTFNPNWATTGPAASLRFVDFSGACASFISYGDVLFREAAIRAMADSKADICLAIDTEWRNRYQARSQSDIDIAEKVVLQGESLLRIGKDVPLEQASAEFAGLLRLSARASEALAHALVDRVFEAGAGLPEVVAHLLAAGCSCDYVDLMGDWAELNAPQDLARFVLGTKAETLERIQPLLRSGVVDDQIRFTHEDWSEASRAVIDRISARFSGGQLIVRSSSLSEDLWDQSAAGAHESIGNVSATDADQLRRAIEDVLASYGDTDPGNQVFVQQMLSEVQSSGVVMTRTPSNSGPYYVINYDVVSNRTDTVTAGLGAHIKTLYLRKDSSLPAAHALYRLIEVVREIEGLVSYDSLDIEFAFDMSGECHIFQVRPMTLTSSSVEDESIFAACDAAALRFEAYQDAHCFLVGDRAIFSVMSDWNPAEIIGTKPRPLAYSLYRRLITNEVWAQQRAEYGCRDVRPCPLLVDFLGHPFIDVRASFNSFVPSDLSDGAASKLVNHYLERLCQHPHLHDKVEFDILFTFLPLDHESQMSRLLDDGFTNQEVAELATNLRRITAAALQRVDGDLAEIERLSSRYDVIVGCQLPGLGRAHRLLEDVRCIGAPAFSHLARAGFIAVGLLHSLIREGAIDQDDFDDFMKSVETVSTRIKDDAWRCKRGDLSSHDFAAKYGHLRPGTYDINSPCYLSDADLYLGPIVDAALEPTAGVPEYWNAAIRTRIGERLAEEKLGVDCAEFEAFLRHAIEGREYGKFVFTRNLSLALEDIAAFGEDLGLTRDDLSFLTIEDLLMLSEHPARANNESIQPMVDAGRSAFEQTQLCSVPGQIYSGQDFRFFELLASEPNFITQKTARADVAVLTATSDRTLLNSLEGKIVVLPNADPGYDWIFSRKIAGLVTMYGGANSHMSIRAAEFDLPAAIGTGESLYELVANARAVELNCGARRIEIIH